MPTDPFEGLNVFLAVSRHKSFTAAAVELGVTPTAVSQKIKNLEHRLGVVLFQRTTRRVAFTEAGSALFGRLATATTEIEDALAALAGYRNRPIGTLRITAPRGAVPVLTPVVARMRERHPAVNLEISIDDAFVDIVSSGFDAGVRIGDSIEKDMVRVQLTKTTAWSIVASPGYLTKHGRPRSPEDLLRHQAIRQRLRATNAIYRWELSRRGRTITVDVPGGLVVDDVDLLIAVAREGLGLAYVLDASAEADLASGTLERVLTSYVTNGPGLFLYFPARTQSQPKLRALLDIVEELRSKG
jgi:DNA-binding transcriptional LysR family regulator